MCLLLTEYDSYDALSGGFLIMHQHAYLIRRGLA